MPKAKIKTNQIKRQLDQTPTELIMELAFRIRVLEATLIDNKLLTMKNFRKTAYNVQKEFDDTKKEIIKEEKNKPKGQLENYFG